MKAEAIARTLLAAALLGGVAAALPVQSAESPPPERNAILHVVPREVLFFSAQNGGWTSVRLEAGERVLRQGVGENVALVVTDVRAIAFSAPLSVAAEVIVRASSEDAVEAATTSGNAAAVITRRHAYGFSALTGRWTAVERFLPR